MRSTIPSAPECVCSTMRSPSVDIPRRTQNSCTYTPAQVPIDARKSANGVGALRSGNWSVATVNGPKCASTRDPPGKSMIISMNAISLPRGAGFAALRLVLVERLRHGSGVGDVPVTHRAPIGRASCRSRAARAIDHDPRVGGDVSALGDTDDHVVERNAGRPVEMAEPVLEFRSHVDHDVDRPAAIRARP